MTPLLKGLKNARAYYQRSPSEKVFRADISSHRPEPDTSSWEVKRDRTKNPTILRPTGKRTAASERKHRYDASWEGGLRAIGAAVRQGAKFTSSTLHFKTGR